MTYRGSHRETMGDHPDAAVAGFPAISDDVACAKEHLSGGVEELEAWGKLGHIAT